MSPTASQARFNSVAMFLADLSFISRDQFYDWNIYASYVCFIKFHKRFSKLRFIVKVSGKFRAFVQLLFLRISTKSASPQSSLIPFKSVMNRFSLFSASRTYEDLDRVASVMSFRSCETVYCFDTWFDFFDLPRWAIRRRAWPKLLVVTSPSSKASIKMFCN